MTDIPTWLQPRVSFPLEEVGRMVHQGAWADVAQKATRLVRENKVTIGLNMPQSVTGHVIGDHGEYECQITRTDPSSSRIDYWQCTCPWNDYAWDRTRQWKKYEGRPCFIGSTPVAMADGTFKAISEIVPGDRVATTDGVGEVADLWTSEYDGPMRRIYRAGSPFAIEATADHGFPSIKGSAERTSSAFYHEKKRVLGRDWARVEAQDLAQGDWLDGSYPTSVVPFLLDVEPLSENFHTSDGRVYKSAYAKGHPKLEREQRLSSVEILDLPDGIEEALHARVEMAGDCWEWHGPLKNGHGTFSYKNRARNARRTAWALAGKDMSSGRRLMRTCANERCISPEHMKTNEVTTVGKRVQTTLPAMLTASDALATILGWYLAEGSVENDGCIVVWSLSATEAHVFDILQEALGALDAGVAKSYTQGNKLTVKVSNALLATVCRHLCGEGSRQKFIHGSVMLAEHSFQRRLLDCYMEGDGNVDESGVIFVNTASDMLARQLVLLGARLEGIVPAHSRGKNSGGPTRRDADDLTINRIVFGRQKMHGRIMLPDGHYAVRVAKVEEFHHKGLVYNLNVLPQHTYNVEGVSCFNCSHVFALYWKGLSTPLDSGSLEDGMKAAPGQRTKQFSEQEQFDQSGGQLPGISEEMADKGELESLPRTFTPDGEMLGPDGLPVKDDTLGPVPSTGLPPGETITTQPQSNPFAPKGPVGPSNPFTPKPQVPQREHLRLFDITAPPGGQPVPPTNPMSIPGANPPGWENPGNPTQFPGTFSKVAMGVNGDLPEGLEMTKEVNPITGNSMYVARLDGLQVGILHVGAGTIEGISVAARLRRRGVGSALLEFARTFEPVRHDSSDLSEDGRAWSEHVGSEHPITRHLSEIDRIAQSMPKSEHGDWCGRASEDVSKYLSGLGIANTPYLSGYGSEDGEDLEGGTDWDHTHCYVVLDDGTIIDPTITQFTRGQFDNYPHHPSVPNVAVIPYGHPFGERYEAHKTGLRFVQSPAWLRHAAQKAQPGETVMVDVQLENPHDASKWVPATVVEYIADTEGEMWDEDDYLVEFEEVPGGLEGHGEGRTIKVPESWVHAEGIAEDWKDQSEMPGSDEAVYHGEDRIAGLNGELPEGVEITREDHPPAHEDDDASYTYTARLDGAIVGTINVGDPYGTGQRVNQVQVPEEMRRKGIATALLQRARGELGEIEHGALMTPMSVGWADHVGNVQPVVTIYSSQFHWGSADDELETWVKEMLRHNLRAVFQLRNAVMLEASGGKIPMPDAEPIGTSEDGLPQYRTIDLGWDPTQQRRMNQSEQNPVTGLQGPPQHEGQYAEARAGRRGEITDIEPFMKMVHVHIPLDDSGPLHPHLLKGWVDFKDVIPLVNGAPTPFRSSP